MPQTPEPAAACPATASPATASPATASPATASPATASPATASPATATTDIVVIGSGIGGLSCAGLLARYGYRVTVCESHSIPGGAAHGFERQGFRFDSGPSLYSGMSDPTSPNPLRHVLAALGEDVPWLQYKTWGCRLPEGDFNTDVGLDQFCQVLQSLRGPAAVAEWRSLQQLMRPYSQAAIALPPAALRSDWGVWQTAGPLLPQVLPHIARLPALTGAFGALTQRVIRDPLIHNWLELLSFLISGLPADGTSAAAMAFLFADWYRPGVQLDYPQGGAAAFVEAFVRGLRKYGGELRLKTPVAQIIVEQNRAVGVKLHNGQTLRARKAIVSAISAWDLLPLLPESVGRKLRRDLYRKSPSDPQQSPQQNPHHADENQSPIMPACGSFLHLHLGIDATGLEQLVPDLACHYITVQDWSWGITAPLNVIVMSIPSVLDPSLAPTGKHSIHVYTPANEPYALWESCPYPGDAYHQLKQERSQPLWQALERIIPDVRQRCEVALVGTPRTHERFLRRYRGSYGPALPAGQLNFPGPKTSVSGLFCCGDSTFPGIGLPAVAASGLLAAHAIAPVQVQRDMLQQIGIL